jgi:hypothetical protein
MDLAVLADGEHPLDHAAVEVAPSPGRTLKRSSSTAVPPLCALSECTVTRRDGMATKRYKRNFKELETRRRHGMRLLARGVSQSDVARTCGVSRQTAMTWARLLPEDPHPWRRRPLGRPAGSARRKQAVLSPTALWRTPTRRLSWCRFPQARKGSA